MFFLFPFCVITCYLEVYDAEFWTENLYHLWFYKYH
jgi:TRAP-type mannitol/chloroaromatic compound transport system permease small subunit